MSRTVLVLALVAACGGGSSSGPRPAPAATTSGSSDDAPAPEASSGGQRPLEENLPALVAGAVEMFETVATALASTGTDCVAAAAKLEGLRGRYDALIAAARRAEGDGRGPEIEALLEPHQARVHAALEKMSPTVKACDQDPAFARAFEAITGSRGR